MFAPRSQPQVDLADQDRVQSGRFCPQTGRKPPATAVPRDFSSWPAPCLKESMKVAAKHEDPKALDYFSSTIVPCQTLRAVAVFTIKHAVLLVGFTAGIMALVRLILAD